MSDRLAKLRDGYFTDVGKLSRFRHDIDFADVREHSAFAKFAESLKLK